jgi:prepilin-type N-terminal cleavage/methylation domain-containing protein
VADGGTPRLPWSAGPARPIRTRARAGFTLLEVLVSVAVLAFALVSLLGLHLRNLTLIDRDQRVTEATFLARALMTEVEVERFPELGLETGDFEERWPGRYTDLRWEREVVPAPFPLPEVREVRVRVFRGDEESGDDVTLVYYVRQR